MFSMGKHSMGKGLGIPSRPKEAASGAEDKILRPGFSVLLALEQSPLRSDTTDKDLTR
jgi:hypothetical protein